MTLTRFQTDKRLWKWITWILFGVSWLVPSFTFAKSGPVYPAVTLFWWLLRAFWDSDVPLTELKMPAIVLAGQAVIFGVASIVLAWLLQCVVVLVRSRKAVNGKPLSSPRGQ